MSMARATDGLRKRSAPLERKSNGALRSDAARYLRFLAPPRRSGDRAALFRGDRFAVLRALLADADLREAAFFMADFRADDLATALAVDFPAIFRVVAFTTAFCKTRAGVASATCRFECTAKAPP